MSYTMSGSWVALVTPFDADQRIDYEALYGLLDWHQAEGTTGILLLGTTGEAPTVTHTERRQLIAAAVRHLDGALPVMVGISSASTRQALLWAKEAEELGANACMASLPYYNRPTPEGVVAHFDRITHACDLPLLVYHVPSRTGLDLSLDTVRELVALPNLIGLKDASSDLGRLEADRLAAPDWSFLSGCDETACDYVLAGGDGVISVAANIVPNLMAKMMGAAAGGHATSALSMHAHLSDLFEALFCQTNPIPVKWMLAEQGRIMPGLRLPMTPLGARFQDHCRDVLGALSC